MERQEQKAWIVNLVSIIVIFGVFAISCLVLSNIGIRVYRNVVMTNDDNFKLRTSLSYVATKIRQTDTINYPRLIDQDGICCLVLGEEINDTWYETIIYFADGSLFEMFQEAGQPYILEYGTKIMEIANFTFQFEDNGMLVLTAENKSKTQESLALTLRSRR